MMNLSTICENRGTFLGLFFAVVVVVVCRAEDKPAGAGESPSLEETIKNSEKAASSPSGPAAVSEAAPAPSSAPGAPPSKSTEGTPALAAQPPAGPASPAPTAPEPGKKETRAAAPDAGASAPPIVPTGQMPSPMKFEGVPIGNVARILSARMNLPIAIEANATAPITGDYSHMDMRKALADAAGQAGLTVIAAGPNGENGYSMVPHARIAGIKAGARGAVEAVFAEAKPMKTSAVEDEALADGNRRRVELLKKRQALLEAEARLRR